MDNTLTVSVNCNNFLSDVKQRTSVTMYICNCFMFFQLN